MNVEGKRVFGFVGTRIAFPWCSKGFRDLEGSPLLSNLFQRLKGSCSLREANNRAS